MLAGWGLASEACVSATGAETVTDLTAGTAAGDAGGRRHRHVHDRQRRRAAALHGLTLSKLTRGEVGSFPFTVSGSGDARQTLTTREEDVAVSGDPLSLEAGQYRLGE